MLLNYFVKYLRSKDRHVQEVIAANCHVRLRHSKTVLKYLSGKHQISVVCVFLNSVISVRVSQTNVQNFNRQWSPNITIAKYTHNFIQTPISSNANSAGRLKIPSKIPATKNIPTTHNTRI